MGETLWDLYALGGAPLETAASFRRVPGGAAVNVAIALARRGVRAGLCAGLGDDPMGRGLRDQLAEHGVDVRHVKLVAERTGLVFLERARSPHLPAAAPGQTSRPSNFPQVVSYRHPEEESAALARAIPERLQARVLHVGSILPSRTMIRLLAGTMRQARRDGCLVMLDLNARPRLFRQPGDFRYRAVLKEADIVKCSVRDLAVLGLDAEGRAIASLLRPSATLLVTNRAGPARALGPFGQALRAPRHAAKENAAGAGDAFCAGVIAAVLRRGSDKQPDARFWDEALGEGHFEAGKRLRSR
jgi:sugar/nucleoside kinase (ribokinase family)